MLFALRSFPFAIATRMSSTGSLQNKGPIYTAIEKKITREFQPTLLQINNESRLHAGHQAMRGVESTETHFRLKIVSDKFKNKSSVQRHRMIYNLLKDELSPSNPEGTIHALQLTTQTPEETVSK